MTIENAIKIKESKKQELKNLLEERKRIFNSLDSRFSRYNLKNNTYKIALNTGFSLIEVDCIYKSNSL